MLSPAPAPPKPVTVPPDRVVLKAGSVSLTAAQFKAIEDGLPESSQARLRGPGLRQFAEYLSKIYVMSEEAKRRKLDETHGYKVQSELQIDGVLASLLSEQVKADTKVDEADSRKYYEDHLKDYEEVTSRHILIRTKDSKVPIKPGAKDLTDEEALAKANELHKRIVAGEDFATLAKAESDDSTASNGGLLPPSPRGRMVPSFDEVSFKLKPGEVSEPVKTPFGYHIIKVEAHVTKTFEQVSPQIEKILLPQKVQKTIDDMTKGAFFDPDFFAAQQPPMPPGTMAPPAGRPPLPPTLVAPPPAAKPAVPPAAAAPPQK